MSITEQNIVRLLTEHYSPYLNAIAQAENTFNPRLRGRGLLLCEDAALQKIVPLIQAIFMGIEDSLNAGKNAFITNIPYDCYNPFFSEYKDCIKEMLQKTFKITMEPSTEVYSRNHQGDHGFYHTPRLQNSPSYRPILSERRTDVQWPEKLTIQWRPSESSTIRGLLDCKDIPGSSQATEEPSHTTPPSPKLALTTVFPPPLPVATVGEEERMEFLSTDLHDPIKQRFVQAIDGAKESVTLLTFSFSCQEIIQALRRAADRGLAGKVTVIYDSSQPRPNGLGPKVLLYPVSIGNNLYKMHHKLLVIDHTYSWIGSGNIVPDAFESQGNCVLHFSCTQIAKRIEQAAQVYLCNPEAIPNTPLQLLLGGARVRLFSNMGQGRQMHDDLLDRIRSAKHRIFVAMYTFTSKDLIKALCDAKRNGVDVRVVLDRQCTAEINPSSLLETLLDNQILCDWHDGGMLHYKVAIIDDVLITGSCNWTDSAFGRNDETMLCIDPMPVELSRTVEEWWKRIDPAQQSESKGSSENNLGSEPF